MQKIFTLAFRPTFISLPWNHLFSIINQTLNSVSLCLSEMAFYVLGRRMKKNPKYFSH